MAGRRIKPDSDFRLKKCNTRCNDGVDRISQLPDDVIIRILSFLSMKEAAITSVVASRWIDLWKHTPNLDFEHFGIIGGPKRDTIKWVNLILESHKALSLKEFRISFSVRKSSQFEFSKWLEFAFSRQVEKFELDFQFPAGEDMIVLDEIMREIKISPMCDFKYLKELCLKCIRVSGEAIAFFLRDCPLLERLITRDAMFTSDLEIRGGMLNYLDLVSRYSSNTIKISSAPNLTLLKIDHISERMLIENVPKLVKAHLTLRGPDTMHHFANVAAQLEYLYLALDLHHPMAFSVPKMPKLKRLVLNCIQMRRNNPLLVTCLIQASPCLQLFKVEIFEHLHGIFEVPNVERFPHQHLKRFHFRGFRAEAADHIALLRYIVDNCIALEKIFIFPPHPRPYIPDDAEALAAREPILEFTKQQLAGKVPDHIMLYFG